jgi:hypothetical protein
MHIIIFININHRKGKLVRHNTHVKNEAILEVLSEHYVKVSGGKQGIFILYE